MTQEKLNKALLELSECDTEKLDGLFKKCSSGEELSLEDLESVSGGGQSDDETLKKIDKTINEVFELFEYLGEAIRTGTCPICKMQISNQALTGEVFESHVKACHQAT